MPNSEAELVLAGCKHSQASKYLGNTTYTRVGLAKNKDCLVIALGTDALGGSYSAGVSRIQNIGRVYCLGFIVFGVISLFW